MSGGRGRGGELHSRRPPSIRHRIPPIKAPPTGTLLKLWNGAEYRGSNSHNGLMPTGGGICGADVGVIVDTPMVVGN